MKMRLTDLSVKKLKSPTSGQVTHWDEVTPGFGIRCSTKSKSYVVMYGERRLLKTLGRYPALSLAEARKRAKLFMATEASLETPNQEYDFEDLVEVYLEDCRLRLRGNTLQGYSLYLKQVKLSGRISQITQGEILRAIERYTKSPSSQNYAFTTLKVFFNWAVKRQHLTSNPLSVLGRPHKSQSRERVLCDEELKLLLRYTLMHQGDRFHDIVSLLIMTGQRRGEIADLQWSEVETDTLVFSRNRTKNKRAHTVPLGSQAIELLHYIDGGEVHVFGTALSDVPFSGWSRAQRRLVKETGLAHFTLHDLRRTFATNQARLGTPIHVTEKLLNHISGTISGVAAVYNRHSYLDEMRAAVAAHDEYLTDLLAT
ncbi:site-specific recombinase XerD [Litoreibacter meonggei]|uniref:Site-specific recombinase XerD n=1 Tax=Litoreibacter meonggei TaxID=1049199 RepID=A0A497X6G6_9RHOB|nr:tyrosine-type recombinase/integrase [Litoreibacter meonggei]RLJ60734.1 site-specific recombinase XerD [Litoreibacter meonggei]